MACDLTRVLITGGSGMMGRYADFGVRLSRKELDITNSKKATEFISTMKPSAVLHLAALTDMAYCEKYPEEAYRVNAESTKGLVKAATAVNARFIYLSTNAVFDGTKSTPYDETDLPSPANEYGMSKLAGEAYVKEYGREWLIVRTSWVFGGGRATDKRFVGKIIAQLGEPEIKAIDDNLGTPTYAKELIQTIVTLMQEGKVGIVHITNSETASRFEQAKLITDFFKYHGKISCLHLYNLKNTPALLRNEALTSKTVHLRPWQDALQEYLVTEWT